MISGLIQRSFPATVILEQNQEQNDEAIGSAFIADRAERVFEGVGELPAVTIVCRVPLLICR